MNLHHNICEKEREYTEDELAHTQVIESDGMTYYFSQSNYLFVPEGYELTADEKKAAADGELFISEGSSKREEEVYTNLSWNEDGKQHLLFGADLDMSAEELLDMAKQIK